MSRQTAKSRTNSTGERSIIRLKPAFAPAKRRAVSTRVQFISTPGSVSPAPVSRSVRFTHKHRVTHLRDEPTYSPDLATILDISQNIDQVSDLVSALQQKSTPAGSARIVEFPATTAYASRPVLVPTELTVQKSTRPKVKSLLQCNASIHSEVAQPAEGLYKRRFEALKVPVVKESKPRRKGRTDALPFLRKP